MVRRAFADDWQVQNFRSSQSSFQGSGSLFDPDMAIFISSVVNWLLQRDWRNRPNATSARSYFGQYVERTKTTRRALEGEDPYEARDDDSEILSTLKANLVEFPNAIKLREDLANEYMKERKIDLEIKVRKDIVRMEIWTVGIQELEAAYNRQGNVDAAISGWKELIIAEFRLRPFDFRRRHVLYVRLQTAFRAKGIGPAEIEYWKNAVVDSGIHNSAYEFLMESLRIVGGDRAVLETWRELVHRYPDRDDFQSVFQTVMLGESRANN